MGQTFLEEFYKLFSKKTGKTAEEVKEFVKGYSVEYQIRLLKAYMKYVQGLYRNAAKYQKGMLEEFKDAPGAYFDIDQKKINVVLKAPPKKFGRAKETTEEEIKEKYYKEKEAPVILLNSKRLTALQMERFPQNDFFNKYEANVNNPDLKALYELQELVVAEKEELNEKIEKELTVGMQKYIEKIKGLPNKEERLEMLKDAINFVKSLDDIA